MMNNCHANFDYCWSKKQKSNPNISTNNFKAIEKLGKGAFGFVYLVKWYYNEDNIHENFLCVLKITSKQQLMKKKAHLFALRERDILQCCHHPNLVKLFTSFKDESNIYLVLEFIAGGDLFSYMQIHERLNEDHTRFYIGQIILAFEYLHCCHIIYRDLKPENIILTDRGYIKLIDFGFAKRINKSTSTMCGTPQFMSPEIILQKKYNKCVDYWALGILTYELLTGIVPFDGENNEDLFDAILHNPIYFQSTIFTTISANFVQGLLTRNPLQRLGCTINNSLDIRYHPWFQQYLYSFEQLEQQSIPAFYIPSNLTVYTNYPLKFIEVTPLKNPINDKIFDNF
ncbi:unnamed protein product [Rotaria sordida]|uniref:Protein kinase domain-containing protein n=1 Tax=Rotaria sordida TaxID=392033 RepID=A0A815ATV5_9BILA|nr:unnamed protein product [Rotaria sordida]CAF1261213.1 unnamed protein product [Rotaria sordida]CAF3825428.1 unnamed protein product [Rotaria sordida]CAF3834632.1 unnamed protein product [Rotaria sordida]